MIELRGALYHSNREERLARWLDRCSWEAGLSFTSYGVNVGVRVNLGAMLDQITERLPLGWEPALQTEVDALFSLRAATPGDPLQSRYHRAYHESKRLTRSQDLSWVLSVVESSLELYVAEHAKERVFVHAGVVGVNGRAIVIPGSSFSGKSTLVAALVRAGAAYYSDEFAVLDKEGWVHPYVRPLSMRGEPGKPAVKHSIESLGGAIGDTPLPVGLIVVTRYEPKARGQLQALSKGQASMALLANTVCARSRPRQALESIGLAVKGARALTGARDEADVLAPFLLGELANHTPNGM